MPTDPLRYPEERRLASVLFADVQGFTAMAEQLDFETVSDLLKGIWERLDRAIENHNGYIDKHLGDGVMAIWGAPFAGENDAEQAVAAGLDLIKALEEYCESSHIPGADSLKLRVGINTGAVFAGYVGTRREYTVFGDTVNLASRLEQIASAGSVVIGENTLRMVHNSFKVKRLEPTIAKGRTEMVQPYVVEGTKSLSGRIRSHAYAVDSLQTNMVGRDEELSKLKMIYDQAFGGCKPIMALINGEGGIGKTRLLMEFGNLLEDSGEKVSIISTQGQAQTSKMPFSLWRVLIRNRFGMRNEDTALETVDKWTRGLQSVWASDAQHLKDEANQLLGEMIGIQSAEQDSQTNSQYSQQNADRDENLERVFAFSIELLRCFSNDKHLILFFDDMQWADRESLQLLARLVSSITEDVPLKIMIVGAARPEFLKLHSQWHNLARVIDLYPLELTPALVSRAYPDLHFLPENILQEISLHAEGNPFFLGEIIKKLVKEGSLDLLSKSQHANMDSQDIRNRLMSQIPEALHVTLQARLDNLSREAREVALLASVVGRVFWVGAVLAAARSTPVPGSMPLLNIPETVIDRFIQDGLRQLVRADLAFPRIGTKYSDDQEYYFKNSYLRDVAYDMISNRNRAQYHTAVAEWARQYSDQLLDPHSQSVFHSMSLEHERKATANAKLPTGILPPFPLEK